MVEQGCAGGRTQHGRLHTVLVRPSDLRRQEPGADGNADGVVLGAAAVPVLEGSRVRLRGMGGKDSGLVCGAPRTFDGRRFAQRVNDSRRTREAVGCLLIQSQGTATRQNDPLVWAFARRRVGHHIVAYDTRR